MCTCTYREELQAALADTELRVVHAEEQARALGEQLAELRSSSAAELAAAAGRHEGELAQLRLAAAQAAEATEAAKRWVRHMLVAGPVTCVYFSFLFPAFSLSFSWPFLLFFCLQRVRAPSSAAAPVLCHGPGAI